MNFLRANVLIVFLLFSMVAMAGALFRHLNDADRLGAVVGGEDLGARDKVVYLDTGDGDFMAKRKPGGADWLAQHKEPGQTYGQYLASKPNLPDKRRNVIYVLPVGDFDKGVAPDLKVLLEYTRAYYYPMKVVMKKVVSDEKVRAKSRLNGGVKQWLAPDVLRWMSDDLGKDAYAMIAVTMTDLYPDPKWNFVFGMASLRNRVGVFSFSRYRSEDSLTVLRRSAKVLTHEIGHMFGIKHCIFYECNMNGANHLGEVDQAPLHLCPVCLRKMQGAVKFDALGRYEELYKFYVKYKMDDEAAWVKRRIDKIKLAG